MSRRASLEVHTPAVIDGQFIDKVHTLCRDFYPENIMNEDEISEVDESPEQHIVSRRTNQLIDVIPAKNQRDKIIFFEDTSFYFGRVNFENDASRLRSKVGQIADSIADNLEAIFPEVDLVTLELEKAVTSSIVTRHDPRVRTNLLTLKASKKEDGLPDLMDLLTQALDSRSSTIYDRRFLTKGLSRVIPIAKIPDSVVASDTYGTFINNIEEFMPITAVVEVGVHSNGNPVEYPTVETR